jgi:hypothetical protein
MKRLPEIDWFLYDIKDDQKKPVCTFNAEVTAVAEVHTSAGAELHPVLKLTFARGDPLEVTVPLAGIERIDWSSLDKRCILNPDCPKAKQYLANIIRLGLTNEDIEVETRYRLERTGLHHLGKGLVYNMGNRVATWSPDNEPLPKYELAPSSFNLDIDTDRYSKRAAFDGMRELISLSEIGRPLAAHSISAISRAAYIAVGAPPCSVIDIVTTTGKFKTYYSATLTQFYNRNENVAPISRMDGTVRFIEEILYEYSECTAVIDDKCTAASRAIKRKNDDTAERITRNVGDKTGRGRMSGKTRVQLEPRGNVVTTSEYETGIKSTAARGLILPLVNPIDGSHMDKYQRQEPLIISTFYFHYVEWYVSRYHDICAMLTTRLTNFRKNPPQIHPRLRDTQFALHTAYMMLMEFCKDSGFITVEEANAETNSFASQLVKLIQAQHTRINPGDDEADEVDCLKLIRKLCESKSFRLAKSKEVFNPDKHDGLLYYDCLCLRREILDAKIRKIIRGVKIDDVVKNLAAQKALKLVDNKHTVRIHMAG